MGSYRDDRSLYGPILLMGGCVVSTPPDSTAFVVLLADLPDRETDCACPTAPLAQMPLASATRRWSTAPELHTAPLGEGWSLYCNPLLGGPPAVLNPPAVERLTAFAAPQPLHQPVDQRLASARLIVPEGYPAPAPRGQTDTLTAWIHITNACNLECPYCYIQKSAARMSFATGVKAIDTLIATAQRRGFTQLKLKYAGGEAALHFRMVQQLHAYAAEQAERAGIALRAVVLSNGTVIPEAFAAWLAASGVRLMLSVDGVGADHDAQRPWKGGGTGAFAALECNLHERLLPRGIRPDVCITVTGPTAHTARHAVTWALQHDLPFSLNFYRENDQSKTHRHLRLEEQQLIAGLLDAYAAIEQALPDQPILDGLLDLVRAQAHGHTCGVGSNYVVITHEGQVAQCQMDLERARPFAPGADLIELAAAGPIHNPHVDAKEGCRSCVWRYRCAGGCPIVTLRATGRTDIKSPNCAIYQALMPAALRLEGLRLLRAAGSG